MHILQVLANHVLIKSANHNHGHSAVCVVTVATRRRFIAQFAVDKRHTIYNKLLQNRHLIVDVTELIAPCLIVTRDSSGIFQHSHHRIDFRLDVFLCISALAILRPTPLQTVDVGIVAHQTLPPKRHKLLVAAHDVVGLITPNVGVRLIVTRIAIGNIKIPQRHLPTVVKFSRSCMFLAIFI